MPPKSRRKRSTICARSRRIRKLWPSAKSASIITTIFRPREIQREVFIDATETRPRPGSAHHHSHPRSLGRHYVHPPRALARRQASCTASRAIPAQAQEALDLGFHLAYGGVLTFKTADNVRESARITPDDRLLIETDAPYLAPIPYRGKRNEPAFMIGDRAEACRGPRNSPSEHIAALTTANFERLCLRPRNANRYTEVSDGN